MIGKLVVDLHWCSVLPGRTVVKGGRGKSGGKVEGVEAGTVDPDDLADRPGEADPGVGGQVPGFGEANFAEGEELEDRGRRGPGTGIEDRPVGEIEG